jgi:hypothetical protein
MLNHVLFLSSQELKVPCSKTAEKKVRKSKASINQAMSQIFAKINKLIQDIQNTDAWTLKDIRNMLFRDRIMELIDMKRRYDEVEPHKIDPELIEALQDKKITTIQDPQECQGLIAMLQNKKFHLENARVIRALQKVFDDNLQAAEKRTRGKQAFDVRRMISPTSEKKIKKKSIVRGSLGLCRKKIVDIMTLDDELPPDISMIRLHNISRRYACMQPLATVYRYLEGICEMRTPCSVQSIEVEGKSLAQGLVGKCDYYEPTRHQDNSIMAAGNTSSRLCKGNVNLFYIIKQMYCMTVRTSDFPVVHASEPVYWMRIPLKWVKDIEKRLTKLMSLKHRLLIKDREELDDCIFCTDTKDDCPYYGLATKTMQHGAHAKYILRVDPMNRRQCMSCSRQFCSQCRVELVPGGSHGELSCTDYQILVQTQRAKDRAKLGKTPFDKLTPEEKIQYDAKILQMSEQERSEHQIALNKYAEDLTTIGILKNSKACANPVCGIRFERQDGCAKMTCSHCGKYTCFECGGAIDPNIGYGHFDQIRSDGTMCTLWGRIN